MNRKNIFVIVTMLVCFISTSVYAHDIEVTNADGVKMYYNIINDTELSVTYRKEGNSRWVTYQGSIVIPSSVVYDGKTYYVTSIDSDAFSYCDYLFSVTIPGSISAIPDFAFSNLKKLKSVVILDGVTSIGNYAFRGCPGLTSFTLPKTVITFGDYVFGGCDNLETLVVENDNPVYDSREGCNAIIKTGTNTLVAGCKTTTIPNSVTCIGTAAFAGYGAITSIEIPNSVTTIQGWAFASCTGLTSVILSNAVTDIGEYAFYDCMGLASISIPNNVTNIKSSTFYGCTSLTSFTIPNGVVTIGSLAFNGCGLHSVTIPSSVETLSNSAFNGCSLLETIIVEEGNPKYDSRDNCNAIIETATNTLVSGCKSTIIPNSVTAIGENAFYGCAGPANFTIPNHVTSIAKNAFYRCGGISKLTINSNQLNVDTYAFSSCPIVDVYCYTGAENVVWPGSFGFNEKTIFHVLDKQAYKTKFPNAGIEFYGMDEQEAICINDFYYRILSETDKTAKVVGGPVETDIVIPGSLVSNGVTYSVTTIDDNAFNQCSYLNSVKIPGSITTIGASAFAYCHKLKKVIVPDIAAWCSVSFGNNDSNPLYHANHLFSDENTEITDLSIPSGVSAISKLAFYACKGLQSVTIPSSVVSVETDAFSGCSSVVDVYCYTEADNMTWNGAFGFAGTNTLFHVENTSAYRKKFPNAKVSFFGLNQYITVDGICYDIISDTDQTAKVRSRWSGDYSGDVNIPGIITFGNVNYRVIEIGSYAFYNDTDVTSVSIPNSIVTIGYSAFNGCKSIVSITIPKSVTSIGEDVFSGCSNLESVIVAEGNPVFDSRENCNAVINTETNTLVAGCKTTTIPNSVSCIGESAFAGCSSLTSITIPNSVFSIESNAFEDCSELKSIIVTEGNPVFDSRENCNAIIRSQTNKLVVGCKMTTIPNSVTSIGEGSFMGCSGLTSIEIPNSVTSIGELAFEDCSGLTSISIPNSVTSIGEGSFMGCSGLTSIEIPNSVTSIGELAFEDCSGLTSITIPNSVTTIGEYVFANAGLTSVTLSNNLTSIVDGMFSACQKLTSIIIPNSVTSIGEDVFGSCRSLTSIVIPNSVTSIGNWAFNYCSGLTSIEIPNSVTSIGEYAFENCEGLTSITIPNSVTSIGEGAFYECTSLTTITIPNSVTSIGEDAFYGCTGLTSITISNGVITIGGDAFMQCSGLTSIEIPNSVTSIGDCAFEDCTSLVSIIVGWEEPIAVSSSTFDNVYDATLYVPAGCKSAYESADYWKDFKEIVEMGPESIEPTDISTLTDAIYANAAAGLKGGDCTLTVCLKNEQATSAYSFDLKLPEGVSLAKDGDDEYIYTLSTRHNGHAPSLNYNETTGVYSFAVLSLSSKEIKNNDGAIWTLKLNVAEDMEVGDYPVKIQNAKYSLTSGSAKVTMPEVTSILTIEDYKKGDVNGDGDVDIADAVCIVNHVVGKETPVFIAAAADVNGDGDADIADAVRIVNLVVGKIPALAPRRDWRSMLEPE